jgi:hypothetical protein
LHITNNSKHITTIYLPTWRGSRFSLWFLLRAFLGGLVY